MLDIMTLKNRVKSYCDRKNMAVTKFERTAGLSNGYFKDNLKRMSDDKIESIHRAYPDLNIDWLITGNGTMLKSEPQYVECEEVVENKKMVSISLLSAEDEIEVDIDSLMRTWHTTPEKLATIIGEDIAFIRACNSKLRPRHIVALQKYYGDAVIDKYAKYPNNIKAEITETIPMLPSEIATEPEQDIRMYIESSGSELERVNPTQLLRHADVAEKILHTSMFPTFQPEDIVFVRFIPHAMQIVDGNTYYIDSKTYPTLIRRVKLEGDSHLRLIAQNKQFADIIMPRADINNLGAIVGLLRMNFGNQYDEMEELRHKKDSHLERMMELLEQSTEQQGKLIDHICREK